MGGSKAAQRYAKAVLAEAKSSNTADSVFDDMKSIAGTIAASRELQTVLKSPVVKASDKQNALLEIFKDVSAGSKNLIEVLVANQRIDKLEQVAHAYVDLYNDFKGVKVARVTTAVPITPEIEKRVIAKVREMTGSDKITLHNVVDQDIIGGFVLRVGDMQYNASIADNLNKLKRQFTIN
jgi:F-type H+-transporting ATPase subunit delta